MKREGVNLFGVKFVLWSTNLMNSSVAEANDADLFFMGIALSGAEMAAAKGETPVGAVVVREKEVVGRGYNRREELQDPTAHAEILALREAAKNLQSWRLSDCQIYVTLEPCIMCVGAMIQARVGTLIFGCLDPKGGAVESLYRLGDDSRLNHRLSMRRGILQADCAAILENFFARLRTKKKLDKKAERWPSPAEGA